jgi:4-diphosphocytidyl-2-C-methyl-D-erythritol kinase
MPNDGPAMTRIELAYAKVNLTLRVLGRRSDGYHELASLVAFADISDTVTVTMLPAGNADRLTVTGPFGDGIAGENLLARAMALLRAGYPQLPANAVHLEKHLPVAAGLGGGSADVAALLRIMRGLDAAGGADIPWMKIAAQLGSDVPVCLACRPALIQGRGERMSFVSALPGMHAVLVNPRIPLSTASVFAALHAGPAPHSVADCRAPSFTRPDEVLSFMREHGNDMESAAIGLLPAIGEIKAVLTGQTGCLHAAMSGSGPTCFGMFASEAAARRAAAAIAAVRPLWWVKPTRIIGTRRVD